MTTVTSAPFTVRVLDASSDTRPQYVRDAPLMTWSTIPGTKLSSVQYADPNGWSKSLMLAEAGSALKHAGSELFIMNGGHYDGSSNAVYSVKLGQEAPAWVARRPPTPAEYIVENQPYYLPEADGQARPTSRHTYWNMMFHQQRNLVMFFGCAASYGTGSGSFSTVDAFDPATNDYLPPGSFANVPSGQYTGRPIAMDAAGNVYEQPHDGMATVRRWDSVTGQWATLPGAHAVHQSNVRLLVDEIRNRLVRFDDIRPTLMPLPDAAESFGPDYSGEASKIGRWNAVVHIPAIGSAVDDRYLALPTKTGLPAEIYAIDPDSFAVTALVVSGTKPVIANTGLGRIYGRFQYAPELGILILLRDEKSDIDFIRLR